MKIHKLKGDNKPKDINSIPVYWVMCDTKDVYKSYAISVDKNAVHLADGGWMPPKDCFLTPEQALANAKIPFITDEDRPYFNQIIKETKVKIKKAIQEVLDDIQ